MNITDVDVSIIIPAYNEESTIAFALEAALLQRTEFRYEIIVVNDASTDSTEAIVRDYVQRHPDLIRLISHKKNSGKGGAFRSGHNQSKGRFFQVLDADDYFTDNYKLQKQKDFLDKNPEYIACCHNNIRLLRNEEILFENFLTEEKTFSYNESIAKSYYAHTSTFLYRKITSSLPDFFNSEAMRGDDSCFFLPYLPFQGTGKIFTRHCKCLYFSRQWNMVLNGSIQTA
jgi:glycosyltransferase involved in cell wall biosynthesis